MRNYLIALPVVALSACSFIDQPYVDYSSGTSSGQYNQGCSTGACAPGQSYSVAGQSHGASGHAGNNTNHWPDKNLVPSYENGGAYGQGPVHVNPTGYGHNGYGHNGYGGPQAQAYGQPPHLRGLRGQKRGNIYGTLGGVLYDTDIDSYGIEGRLGYDSGNYWGVEVEGSVGIIDDSDTIETVDLDLGFDYNVAAFAVARLPIGKRFSVHARGGYDFRSVGIEAEDLDGNTFEDDLDLDGFAYGIGAEYALSPRSGLRLDYTEYRGGDGLGSDSISASYTRKF